MKIDIHKLCDRAVAVAIVIMIVAIAILLLCASVLLANDVYDTVWGESCVYKGADNDQVS